MKLLPQEKISILRKIFEDRVNESNIEHRTSVEGLLLKLERGYTNLTMAAYVDDIENPKCCLVMSLFLGLVTDDHYANIALIYLTPELRGSVSYGKLLLETAEAYAKYHQAQTLMGTSWLYKGSKGIDWFWKKNGFQPQENIYVKHLT